MAAAPKKKKTSQPAKKNTRTPPPPAPTYGREIAGGVCLLLALCAVVSYFQEEALFITFFGGLLKGLLGYGYWLSAPALLLTGLLLLTHRDRPATLRSVCTLLVPVLTGCGLHLLLCARSYEPGLTGLRELWLSGRSLQSGGALSGSLAVGFSAVFGKVLSLILFLLMLLVALCLALHFSPKDAVRRAQERREAEREDIPEEAPPVREKEKPAEKRPHRRAAIDIPLDDEPPAKQPQPRPEEPAFAPKEKKPFFSRKSSAVRTPDQVLRGEPAEEAAPVAPAAPVTSPPAASAAPAPVAKPCEAAKPSVTAQEVRDATEEVTAAVEQELAQPEEAYQYPPITLLDENTADNYTEVGAELRSNSQRLAQTLQSFGVDARPGAVVHGPSVTRYEFTLEQGVKLSKITNLADDIALALGASGVRIAPIPNKISVVGIEVPNRAVTPVRIRDVVESRIFTEHKSPVAFAVGKDIGGSCIVGDIGKLPHVLIAGTTGSGKSVCTNSLIVSILYKSTPEEVRFIMVDPKMVELAPYNGIPHLLIPVVTDPKKAAGALQWAVFEMMKRYKLFSEHGVKDLAGYNALARQDEELKTMPTVVVVIDELADLMLVAAKEVEESICRVAQMGRAAGMHLVIATQRPSSDVITGLMKANIPSRIAFAVASSLESRIILDTTGAEKLVGKGDMLYAPLGAGKPTRVQGCFITPEEIERVVGFVKTTGEAEYSREVMDKIEQAVKEKEKGGGGKTSAEPAEAQEDGDELLPAAVEVVLETGQASVSMLQRRLKLGYSRAARLVDQMEERGIVGPFEGSKPRQLLIDKAKWQELQMSKQPQPEPEIDRSGSIRDVFESRDALE
ncbi:DNA translocase FtsK [Vescimonas sp.]|uniref:DNA translocase FtsK n=1 Tax=Vescimonas sp. TaxID=2892404 RepID=UPI003076C3FC